MLKFLESLNRGLNAVIHAIVELARFVLRGGIEGGLLAWLVAGGQVIGQLFLAPFLGHYSPFVVLLWGGALAGALTGFTAFIGYMRNGGYHHANRSVFNPETRDAIVPVGIIYGAHLLFHGLCELGFAASMSFKAVGLVYWAVSVVARVVMALSEPTLPELPVREAPKEGAKVAGESESSPVVKNKPAFAPMYSRKKVQDFIPSTRKLNDLSEKKVATGPKKSD